MVTYRRQDILHFLKQAVTSAASIATRPGPSTAQTFVVGNTSADLDSIVSSIIYSYFATNSARQYIPVVNLPDVSSGVDLRRLRPELMVALKLALATARGMPGDNDEKAEASLLKEGLLTTRDLRVLLEQAAAKGKQHLDVMMVDWNALPHLPNGHGIPGLSDVLKDDLDLSVVGCIDHHFDEGFVPPAQPSSADPRRIQTPVGSCVSLVINEIRSRGLWHDDTVNRVEHPEHPDAVVNETQAAKLALSAILIDTINMTEENKVSETDIEEVVFLEDKIRYGVNIASGFSWDREQFYSSVAEAKEKAVNNLTMQETLGRDYKEWYEEIYDQPGNSVRVGIMNVGKPLLWLLNKANTSSSTFLDEVHEFSTERNLDVSAVMTTFQDTDGNFNRELAVFVLNAEYLDNAESFAKQGGDALGLTDWKKRITEETPSVGDVTEKDLFRSLKHINLPLSRVWQQTELAKSRKQVAPLLRQAFSGHSHEV
ncbi:Exopolyphosphatase [Ascosphaera pollenicola]|nr:Exopolyphosphatase [Ascosphaera pollenicola]